MSNDHRNTSNDQHSTSIDPLADYLHARAIPSLGEEQMSKKKPKSLTKAVLVAVLLALIIGIIVLGFIGALINTGLLAVLMTFAGYTGGFWALYPVSLGIMGGVVGLAMAAKIGAGNTLGLTLERG